MQFLKKIGLDTFILCLLVAIVLANINPQIGMEREGLSLGDIATWGVAGIFFFYGLRLERDKLKAGLVNVRLHLLVHISTFLLFPAIALVAMWWGDGFNPQGQYYYIWIGVYFLAALPSTVSSSVVMVSIARGNLPAAIFNASISSLLGVFMTPILMSVVMENIEGSHGLGDVLFKLVLQVIVPVILGMALNPKFGEWAVRRKKMFRIFDQSVIVLIVYTSFCDSFAKKMFAGFSFLEIAILTLAMVALFVCVFFIVWGVCKILKFNREDSITAIFCGSKKSLAHASVMSKVLFSNPAIIGVVLLPTMIYHAMQLIIVSAIAEKWGKEENSSLPH